MRKVWVVVANSTIAKVFEAVDVNTLAEKKDFIHPASHLMEHDLVTDRQGESTFGKGQSGPHPYTPKTTHKVKEKHIFAAYIVEVLEKGFTERAFERLYLIAPPAFLGHVRQLLLPQLAKTVAAEIDKDLTQQTAAEVRTYLPPVL